MLVDFVEETLARLAEHFGRQAHMAILPEEPQTIPYIA